MLIAMVKLQSGSLRMILEKRLNFLSSYCYWRQSLFGVRFWIAQSTSMHALSLYWTCFTGSLLSGYDIDFSFYLSFCISLPQNFLCCSWRSSFFVDCRSFFTQSWRQRWFFKLLSPYRHRIRKYGRKPLFFRTSIEKLFLLSVRSKSWTI